MASAFDVLAKDHAEVKRMLTELELGPTAATGADPDQLALARAIPPTRRMGPPRRPPQADACTRSACTVASIARVAPAISMTASRHARLTPHAPVNA